MDARNKDSLKKKDIKTLIVCQLILQSIISYFYSRLYTFSDFTLLLPTNYFLTYCFILFFMFYFLLFVFIYLFYLFAYICNIYIYI